MTALSSSRLSADLFRASYDGDLIALRAAHASGLDLTAARDRNGCSLLHTACARSRADVVHDLVKIPSMMKIACDAKDFPSPLEITCWNGDLAIARMLISSSDMETMPASKLGRIFEEAAYLATYNGDINMLRLLRDEGIDVCRSPPAFDTRVVKPLSHFVPQRMGVVDPSRPWDGDLIASSIRPPPLYLAVMLAHEEAVGWLCDQGALARLIAPKGWPSPLNLCVGRYSSLLDFSYVDYDTGEVNFFTNDDSGFPSFLTLLQTGNAPWPHRLERFTSPSREGTAPFPVAYGPRLDLAAWETFPGCDGDEENGCKSAPVRLCLVPPWRARLRTALRLMAYGLAPPASESIDMGLPNQASPTLIAAARILSSEKQPLSSQLNRTNPRPAPQDGDSDCIELQAALWRGLAAVGCDLSIVYPLYSPLLVEPKPCFLTQVTPLLAMCCPDFLPFKQPEFKFSHHRSDSVLGYGRRWRHFPGDSIAFLYHYHATPAARRAAYEAVLNKCDAGRMQAKRALSVLMAQLGADPRTHLRVQLVDYNYNAFPMVNPESGKPVSDLTVLSYLRDVGEEEWARALWREGCWARRKHMCAARREMRLAMAIPPATDAGAVPGRQM